MKSQDFLLVYNSGPCLFFKAPSYCNKETSCNKFMLNQYSIREIITSSFGLCHPWNCSGRKKVYFYWAITPGHSVEYLHRLQMRYIWLSCTSRSTGLVLLPQELLLPLLLPACSSGTQSTKPWHTNGGREFSATGTCLLNYCSLWRGVESTMSGCRVTLTMEIQFKAALNIKRKKKKTLLNQAIL